MRTVLVHLRSAKREQVEQFLDRVYPRQKGPPWICEGGDDACLYINLHDSLVQAPDEITRLHRELGGAPSVSVSVQSPLVRESNDKFYAITSSGGANGWGTVFDVYAEGFLATLYSFAYTDGSRPIGALVAASDGSLYGTTSSGGTADAGTVFKITKTGKLTTLYNFCAQTYCADGEAPAGTLIQGSNGDLYGTTTGGGSLGRGTLFQITTAGLLTTLHSFSGTDGAFPYAGLVQDSNGSLYGTTYGGGMPS